jgi:hypothetical protein
MSIQREAPRSDVSFSQAQVLALGTELQELDIGRWPRHIE